MSEQKPSPKQINFEFTRPEWVAFFQELMSDYDKYAHELGHLRPVLDRVQYVVVRLYLAQKELNTRAPNVQRVKIEELISNADFYAVERSDVGEFKAGFESALYKVLSILPETDAPKKKQ